MMFSSVRIPVKLLAFLLLPMVLPGPIKPLIAAELDAFAFEPNPGDLDAFIHVPQDLPENPALVVALHGCLQQSGDYDDETGWRKLADEIQFILLLPQQSGSNNPLQCFNWMEDDDNSRDGGEAESIRHMVETAVEQYQIDSSRIFVTGLSAGGAMTSVMLATHPDIFAGGAIIGGLPYKCATISMFASFCLSTGNFWVTASGWAERVTDAVDFEVEQWPKVSIWQGDSDQIVDPVNAEDLMQQWTGVHGIDREPEIDEEVGRNKHLVYQDEQGNQWVEWWTAAGTGHGVPIDPINSCGIDKVPNLSDFQLLNDYMIDDGLCSTRYIARFWGLIP